MASERSMWKQVRTGMEWKCQRLEDKFAKGVPDVLYQALHGAGFLELKYSKKRAREGCVQTLPHFTIEQRMFLEEWHPAFLLWRIDNHWLLFDQEFGMLGHITFDELMEIAAHTWVGPPNWKVLKTLLKAS